MGWAGGARALPNGDGGERAGGQELVAAIWETHIPRTTGQGHGAGAMGRAPGATWCCLHLGELTSVHEWQMVSTPAKHSSVHAMAPSDK